MSGGNPPGPLRRHSDRKLGENMPTIPRHFPRGRGENGCGGLLALSGPGGAA
ncbi:MAG: hypothetical protein ACRDVM_04095 [Acidimicrobiia bacterium]